MSELREKLAELEKHQWDLWSKDIAETESINPNRLARWKDLWATPYSELTESLKDKDREWADKVLGLCLDLFLAECEKSFNQSEMDELNRIAKRMRGE